MNKDTLRATLTALALAALAVAVALSMVGCSSSPATTTLALEYQERWAQTVDCWERELRQEFSGTEPVVLVRSGCTVHSSGTLYYATDDSPTGYATGEVTVRGKITVCDDSERGALRHEMSHWVRYQMTGDMGDNGSGKCDL